MRKRILAYFLTVIMTLSLIPVSAYATENTNEDAELSQSVVNGSLSQDSPVKPSSFNKE